MNRPYLESILWTRDPSARLVWRRRDGMVRHAGAVLFLRRGWWALSPAEVRYLGADSAAAAAALRGAWVTRAPEGWVVTHLDGSRATSAHTAAATLNPGA
jgi:hypothetical protein